jgi:uncharacterized protein
MIRTKILVKVKTNSRQDMINFISGGQFKIKIKAKPINGKANVYLIKYLSKKLSISQKDIKIIKGSYSTNKLLEITYLKMEEIIIRIGSS